MFQELVSEELAYARRLHGDQKSLHEGLSVLYEEYLELQAEVFKKRELRDKEKILRELVQVGAMAQRMAEDAKLMQ